MYLEQRVKRGRHHNKRPRLALQEFCQQECNRVLLVGLYIALAIHGRDLLLLLLLGLVRDLLIHFGLKLRLRLVCRGLLLGLGLSLSIVRHDPHAARGVYY